MSKNQAAAAMHDEDGVVAELVPHDDKSAALATSRNEVQMQLDAAHRYPRSVKRFLNEARELATMTQGTAEACIYSLTRGGKVIAGPSVRLAEICASAYGNMHIASRVVEATDREVIAQGAAWDLEKNLRITIEARRRITNKSGKRYDDDMIGVTGAAAGSIALRNAIFRVIPKAYVDDVYGAARKVAVGDASTLAAKRVEVVARLQKIGVPRERIFPRVGVAAIEDVGLDELEALIGLGTSIKNGERTVDEAFPPPDATADKAKTLEDELRAGKPAAAATPQQPAGKAARGKRGAKTEATPDLPGVAATPAAAAEDDGRDDAAAEEALRKKDREPGED